ncbi:hypothetical protein M0811_04659 [Anaeramoeba ignava]|uniref:Uncharacterized protein n=1 Tax=Anaeramoeba ignava TaxID=1746090 RepID=A0A9Q0LSB5_ANAIG|nr:hypothetical protein M0811_04659 [Anaeramoeba ignava]
MNQMKLSIKIQKKKEKRKKKRICSLCNGIQEKNHREKYLPIQEMKANSTYHIYKNCVRNIQSLEKRKYAYAMCMENTDKKKLEEMIQEEFFKWNATKTRLSNQKRLMKKTLQISKFIEELIKEYFIAINIYLTARSLTFLTKISEKQQKKLIFDNFHSNIVTPIMEYTYMFFSFSLLSIIGIFDFSVSVFFPIKSWHLIDNVIVFIMFSLVSIDIYNIKPEFIVVCGVIESTKEKFNQNFLRKHKFYKDLNAQICNFLVTFFQI